ncbi:unnamed protein product [Rangifer tarandus platyrhynchus]|uniref:Uncharacterized protein n=1 Tax=Rangifer tarandus platyrhynchus TaxID=3082113 RepID=A0AC59ZSK2_RANTA
MGQIDCSLTDWLDMKPLATDHTSHPRRLAPPPAPGAPLQLAHSWSERPRPRAVSSDWLRRGGGRPVGAHTLPAQPMGVRASLTRRPASRQSLNKPHCCTKLQHRSPRPPLAPP